MLMIPKGTVVQPVYGRFSHRIFSATTFNLGFPVALNKNMVVDHYIPNLNTSQITNIPDSLRGSESIKIPFPCRMFVFPCPIDDPKAMFRDQTAHGFLFNMDELVEEE